MEWNDEGDDVSMWGMSNQNECKNEEKLNTHETMKRKTITNTTNNNKNKRDL